MNFNPRAPCGARPPFLAPQGFCTVHFNPRAPCGARRQGISKAANKARISIHAPHAGRDARPATRPGARSLFQSTRPMRGATFDFALVHSNLKFQSTRPMRGATTTPTGAATRRPYFNPRAPCGARRTRGPALTLRRHFNPRAPCGARPAQSTRSEFYTSFQSTRPMRGATRQDPRDG